MTVTLQAQPVTGALFTNDPVFSVGIVAVAELAKIEIAFGVNPFDDTSLDVAGNWTVVTTDNRLAKYKTSARSDRLGVFTAGKATFELDNSARLYDPCYAAGTHFGDFKRNTPVRITGSHNGTDYVQWSGYIRTWTPEYKGKFDSVTVVGAVDALGLLAQYGLAPITAAHAGDSAGDRIGRVLDDFGHPSAYRDLGPDGELQSTTFGVNALQHCQKAAQSVPGGLFYAQRDGTLVFGGQTALTETRQTTSQVTLSHDTAPKYMSLVRSGVGAGYRDLVRIGRSGGTVQTVDNSAANEAPVEHSRTDLLMATDNQAAAVAQFDADLFSTEVQHPKSVKVLLNTVSASVNTELFVRKLRDRVTVEQAPPGGGPDISDQVFIDGISGVITPEAWHVTYTLTSADAYDENLASAPSTWLILDDATTVLDTNTLAY